MKATGSKRYWTLLLGGAIAALTPQWAMAAGTPACTSIGNTATIDFEVGGVGQPQASGVATPFVVGNKVMVTVEKVNAAAVPVVTNASAAQLVAANSYLTFTVTNAGNALQDYTLTASALAGAADPFGGAADTFDLSGVTAYVDVNNNLTYDAGTDTATILSAVDPTVTYGSNTTSGTRTVFVVPTGASPVVLATQGNGTQSVYALEAVSDKGNGAADTVETNSNGTIYKIGGGSCTADIVLAEDTHTSNVAGEIKWDGKDNARSTLKVGTAELTIDKAATTIWDPVNYDNGPKSIPGALVRYVITIANAAGATSATLTTISDTLVASLVMDPDLKTQSLNTATPAAESAAGSGFKAMVSGGTRVGGAGSALTNGVAKYYTTTSSADGIDLSGQLITATLATILPAEAGYTDGELKAGETLTLTFVAVIQ